ncbi:hypothetical protein FIBSPDRAFT_967618 [Athelia psychrophila]|uniref:Uncharacterized protein n=1 Tax=Athelia psychrophila TaxID=1759441 RepID=A0A167VIV5_9AGAM|nr:hypothetical protein FIBSPDRAFT_967618 [Fibularhizoctonia sp. CBS 109695]
MSFLPTLTDALEGAGFLVCFYARHRQKINWQVAKYAFGAYLAQNFIESRIDQFGYGDQYDALTIGDLNPFAIAAHFDILGWIFTAAVTASLPSIYIADKIKAALDGPHHDGANYLQPARVHETYEENAKWLKLMNLYPPDPPLIPTITPHFALQNTALMVVPQPYEGHNVCYPGEVALWDADAAAEANGIAATATATVAVAFEFKRLLSAYARSIFALISVVPNATAIVMEPAITSGHVANRYKRHGGRDIRGAPDPANLIELAAFSLMLLVIPIAARLHTLLSPSRSSKQPDVDPDPDATIAPTSPPAPPQQLGITHDPYDNVPDSYQAELVTDADAQGEDDDQDLLGTVNIKTRASDAVTCAPLGLITQAVHKTEVEDDEHTTRTEDTEAAHTRSDTESDTGNLAGTGAFGVDNLATATHDDESISITGSSASD